LSGRPSKLIVIGLDGLCPELLNRLLDAGDCPHLADLRRRGSVASLLPTVPIDAATSWTSFGTGAFPASHGVSGLQPYQPGQSMSAEPEYREAEDRALHSLTQRCRAEWLWQAAGRAGRRAILVDFPGGWPPSDDALTAVDGAGPLSSPAVRVIGPHLFATQTTDGERPAHVLRTTQPSGWAEPPDSGRAPHEVAFIVTGEAELQPTDFGWIVKPEKGEPPKVDPALMYCCLVIASGKKAGEEVEPPFDTLVICRGRDAQKPVARLRVGEWSDWITEDLSTPAGPARVRFKLHLQALSPGGREIALFRTAMFRADGWASPAEVADRLIEASLGDDATADVPSADGVAWMCRQLAAGAEWDLLLTHLPLPDSLLHRMLNELHPASQQYRPDAEDDAWARLREAMGTVDRFVGQVVEACGDDDTAVAVVSVHGMIPTLKHVWVGKWLIEAGLATYVTDEAGGGLRLYPPETRAILGDSPLAQSVWVSLAGRDPHGIVPPERYEQVRTEIINALLSARDPFTDACPVALALRREDAGFLGPAGDAAGDVVYFLAPGYTSDPRVCSTGLVDPALLSVDGVSGGGGPLQGAHHGYLPGVALGDFSVQGVLLLAGPGVPEGVQRASPLPLPEVAPTLSHLLGIPAPGSAAGAVALDLLELG